MAISLVGYATGGAGSVTLSAHKKGDLILVVICGTGLTSLASGWTKIGASGNAMLAYKFALSDAETCTGFTLGDAMIAFVYRGVGGLGAFGEATSASSGAVSWTGITCNQSNGSSVIVIGEGGNGIATPPSTNPSGFTLVGYDNNGSDRSAILWQKAAATSYTTGTGDTVSNYRSWTLELVAGNPPLVMGSNTKVGTTLSGGVALNMPSGIVAGELLLAFTTNDNTSTTNMAISGWTQVYQEAYTSNTHKIACFAKIAAGSDTATLTGASQDYTATVIRVANHGVSSIATQIKVATRTLASSTTPDAPSLDTGKVAGWLALRHLGVDTTTGSTIGMSSVLGGVLQPIEIASLRSADSTSSSRGQLSKSHPGIQTIPAITDLVTLGATSSHLFQTIAVPGAASAGNPLFWCFP